MTRRLGYGLIALAGAMLLAAILIQSLGLIPAVIEDAVTSATVAMILTVLAIVLVVYGAYRIISVTILEQAENKRRAHTLRNVLRLVFFGIAIAGILGTVTQQYVGLLFSLGIIGFAITFALQQPILSLLGWIYILLKQPYQVGDRVRIDDAKGDVIDVDYLVTTLWEIDGDLVTSHQPSGRIVTVPNSVVLSREVYNYSWEEFPYVWNELLIQVAYETDLEYARTTIREIADDHLGDEMERNINRYRRLLRKTPVELEVRDRPSVNIRQQDSWLELRLRYLVHPKQGQSVRNHLYEAILEEFNNHPDRVKFPIGRNR